MKKSGIKVSSTAEYFAKNLQQVGFSSPTKAVLTTLKEAVDNSLDACEEHGILPDLKVEIEKVGKGSLKNTDQVRIVVEDNGPGIKQKDVPKVFGEYLASSKFGKGKCSRGQQGIGISAATTWAMQTTAKGAKVTTRVKKGKAYESVIQIDLKANKGIQKKHKEVKWDKEHGTRVEFFIDGRVQLNGEAGVIAFLKANILVNPHLTIEYKLPGADWVKQERVSNDIPVIPQATEPHPHTMKLGEFLSHARVFGKMTVKDWLKTGFSRVGDAVIKELVKTGGLKKASLNKNLKDIKDC